MNAKISDYLSKEERARFREASDLVAAWQVLANYALIALGFCLFGWWPNPVTFAVGVAILGGRFVGLGILNHDAAHNALFRTRWLNRSIARWLFSGPTLIDYDSYRDGHLSHHKHAGSLDDPDLRFVRSYPVPSDSMRRKLTRDLIGRTGLRDTLYLSAMAVKRAQWRSLVMHTAMFGVLFAAGIPWSYGLWWAAMIFAVPLFLRIRVMGEHGNVANILSSDVRDHARTTRAGILGRLLFAPNYVNYHCEHHFFANVPGHKLPALHKLLVERGFYDDHPDALARGYTSVLRECIGERMDRPDLSSAANQAGTSLSNMS